VEAKERMIIFRAGDLHLEGLLSVGAPQGEAVVLCHPHPQYGGTMGNNVVTAMAAAFQDHGFSTLRFNFRGVGGSEGQFGDGIDERLDVEAAITFLESDVKPTGVHVGGYSFGTYVGLHAASANERVRGFVGVAPPIALYDFQSVGDGAAKKLFIVGADDAFCPPGRLKAWFESLREPKTLTIIPQTDHFFWGRESALEEALEPYFSGSAG
jgi:alpha/beta superfamily hydrolase